MASHRIELSLPTTDVLNTDVRINVWSDEGLLGELTVSRGSIDWRPAHHHSAYTLEWEQFDDLMRTQARRD
jgi:hypothetical protein